MSEIQLKPCEYRCAHCRDVFRAERTDEEAMAEARQAYGELVDGATEVLCDDCWRALGFDKLEESPRG